MRDDGRGRVLMVFMNMNLHPVAGEHLDRGVERWLRKRVAVHPHKERSADALSLVVFADRLADGSHMVIVETAVHRRTAVPRSAEAYRLGGIAGFGMLDVIGGNQAGDIGQRFDWRGFTCKRMDTHGSSFSSSGFRLVLGLKSCCPSSNLDRATSFYHAVPAVSEKIEGITKIHPERWRFRGEFYRCL